LKAAPIITALPPFASRAVAAHLSGWRHLHRILSSVMHSSEHLDLDGKLGSRLE